MNARLYSQIRGLWYINARLYSPIRGFKYMNAGLYSQIRGCWTIYSNKWFKAYEC